MADANRRSRPVTSTVLALAMSAVPGGCLSSNVRPEDPVYQRIEVLEQRLAQVERLVNSQSLIELAQRLDAVQAEVGELRGEIEELGHAVEQDRDRSRALVGDLDERLRALEERGGGAAAAPAEVATDQGEQVAYDAAMELLKQFRYEQARNAFAAFLKAHPQGKLAGNAQYWIGETHYASKSFKPALTEFQRVIADHPDSDKVPGAWLKVGYCQAELGDAEAARKAFATVAERFPESEAARSALARLKQMSAGKKK